ncbi:MAG: methionyl-tRNA formyltransferase [Candidatus Liptonbacteria bacterium]|nr:methionyl-tRNA formyltransferase [Candidatus Liptonbacteria bacterium]
MTPDTKFVFFGSTKFAAIILEKLIASGFVPMAVVSNPDRPFGRKKTITPPPVKTSVMRQVSSVKDKIIILQPEKLDDEFEREIKGLEPRFGVVAYYAKIIPKKVIGTFPQGLIGVHPSLLPRYRGPSPIQSAILNGEQETGSTLFLLDEKTDHGPMLSALTCEIADDETNEELSKKLAEFGGDLLVAALPKFTAGEIKPASQDESLATYTKKFSAEDAFVEPTMLMNAEQNGAGAAVEIDRKIRALNPEPGVWTMQNGKRVKLLEASLHNGKLKLTKIQIEGEKQKLIG